MGRSLRPIKNIIFLHPDVCGIMDAGSVYPQLVCSRDLEVAPNISSMKQLRFQSWNSLQNSTIADYCIETQQIRGLHPCF